MRSAILSLAAVALAAPATAQDAADPHRRMLAAGYKAAFLCSGIFNAGQSEQVIARDDLARTYPELEPLFPELNATVDREKQRVSVPFAADMPPRVAVWRPHLGCTQLPVGADPDMEIFRMGSPPLDHARLDARPWPMGDRGGTAGARGNRRALARAVEGAFDRRSYGQGSETTAVLVVQDGRIVAERYRADFDRHMSQRTWSVAKSIAATLIGVAVQDKLVDVNRPVAVQAPYQTGEEVRAAIPEWAWRDPRGQITIDQLLRMSSGLSSPTAGNRTDDLYFGGVAFSDQLGSLPLVAKPGTRFRYANNDILLAVRALDHAIGADRIQTIDFPSKRLFWRIGMTRTVAETDWHGIFILSSQVWTTSRDLARLGLLYLADGVWQGERILPPGWLDYVRRHGPAQPASGYGYGAGFWTFPKGSGLPEDAVVMRGNRGQYVVIAPSQRLVIVRRGYDGAQTGFDLDTFIRDILAALS